jgi:hypothetical protein
VDGAPEEKKLLGGRGLARERRSFSVVVVLPASGWEMMAKVRRFRISETSSVM